MHAIFPLLTKGIGHTNFKTPIGEIPEDGDECRYTRHFTYFLAQTASSDGPITITKNGSRNIDTLFYFMNSSGLRWYKRMDEGNGLSIRVLHLVTFRRVTFKAA